MNHLHQTLTQKYQPYHHWHQTKHHNKIHWGVLAIFALFVFSLFFNFTDQIYAQADTQALFDTTMPTISNISGAVAQGQTLTIAGSNMMNENKTKWDSYFTKWPNSYGFEGSSPTADGYCDIMGDCPSTGVYDTTVKLIGNQSMKFHVQGVSSSAYDVLSSYNAITSDYPAYRDMWIRFYARWNLISGGWPTGPIKMLYDLYNYYIQPCGNANGDLPSCMYMKVGSISYTTPIPSGQLQNNKWYLFEVHWKTDTTPYVFDAWMDGVQIFQHNPTTIRDDLSYVLFGIINTFGTNINFSLDHWMDGFVVSSSRIYPPSTIEIGDSPDYASATKIYQEPVFISDTTNQIKLNLTGLGNGPYYLWVTNNQQVRSDAFQIGTTDTQAPTIPQGLTATPISPSQINLSWTASEDDVGVTGYKIYRDGVLLTTNPSSLTTYSDTNLTSSTVYTYAVSAYDAAGNESAQSTSASATTQVPSDTTMPTIFNISGTVAQGQTLTIAGSNMINDLKTNWDPYFTKNPNAYGFEGASPSADGYWDILGPQGGGVYDTNVKLIGNQSIKFHIQGASSNCPWDNLADYVAINPTLTVGDNGDIWIRFYASWNLIGGTWPISHIKMIDSQGSPVNQYYFQPSASGASTTTQMNATYDGTSHLVNIPSISGGQIKNNRWYLFEVHWKADQNPANNIFQAWMDGVQLVDAKPVNNATVDYILMGFINACRTSSSFSMDHWWDGFAVGSSRIYPASVVEIGNSSNYATATKLYQEPIFLSDGSIQIKTNLTGLGSGPYYLWVTNNQQKLSATYNLSGSVIDTTPPSAPANLTATPISSSQINLSWNASTDNVGVTGYKIYRCAGSACAPTAQIATSTTNSYLNTGLAAGTVYTYAVSAYDEAENESESSPPVSATTFKPSDLNYDTKVDQQDLDILKQNWNRTDKPISDINQDSIVDSRDLGIMMSSWKN